MILKTHPPLPSRMGQTAETEDPQIEQIPNLQSSTQNVVSPNEAQTGQKIHKPSFSTRFRLRFQGPSPPSHQSRKQNLDSIKAILFLVILVLLPLIVHSAPFHSYGRFRSPKDKGN